MEAPSLSLYSLPVEEQNMFKLIMLLPVGALVVVVLRTLVGLKTSGTFMPVLIALAFLQTQLIPGVISFVHGRCRWSVHPFVSVHVESAARRAHRDLGDRRRRDHVDRQRVELPARTRSRPDRLRFSR